MGHGRAGVVEFGSGAKHIREGDRILLSWVMPCGNCFQCMCWAENICEDRPQVLAGCFVYCGEKISKHLAPEHVVGQRLSQSRLHPTVCGWLS